VKKGSADDLPGEEAHDVAVISDPTGVDLGGSQPEPPQVEALFDSLLLIRQLMVVYTNKLLLKSIRLRLLRWGWRLAMLVLGTCQSSMFPACKVISTRLHWLRLLLPLERVRHQWHLLRCPLSSWVRASTNTRILLEW
jgi:hypothetical protein